LQKTVGQSAFPMINMGNDTKISDMIHERYYFKKVHKDTIFRQKGKNSRIFWNITFKKIDPNLFFLYF